MVWFKPRGAQDFDPASTLIAFAGLLVTSFLAGFVEEAQNYGRSAGRKVFHMLADAVQNLFAGQEAGAKTIENELNQIAEKAPTIAKSITSEEFQHHITLAENELLQYMKNNGLKDNDKATALAATVRHSTETHILQRQD